MSDQAIKDELLRLENRFWQAIKENDVRTATELTDFPCIIAGGRGVAGVDRKTFEYIMASSSYQVHEFQITDAEARLLTSDVAVIAYTVREKLTVDGELVNLEAADSSTWVRRDGRWLCAMHAESAFGDPYGRDRVKTDQAA